jgi:aryl-alcohol dehydrogenase-like predicted oxidoreductase
MGAEMTTRTTGAACVAAHSGTFRIGGERPVVRLGFGAMRITGPGVWGPPRDHAEAIRVLRRAVALGVTFIDTADSYGPYVSEELIHEALYPYPDDLLVATKAGLVRTGPGVWHPLGRPEYLRQQVEMSLRRLQLERIELLQLHRIDPQVAFEDQVGVLADLQREGKIGYIGLSNVSIEEILAAQLVAPIATVQNRYNLLDRTTEQVLNFCADEGLGFVPWAPIGTGDLARSHEIAQVAREFGVTPRQIAIAWLLRRSPNVIPIPGTSSVSHLEENVAAAAVHLSDAQFEALTAGV